MAQYNAYSDKAFDELVEKGFVEKVRGKYKLTAKAERYLDAVHFNEYLKQNTAEEIRKRIGNKETKLTHDEIIAQLFPND